MKYIVQNYLYCSVLVLILTVLLSADRICTDKICFAQQPAPLADARVSIQGYREPNAETKTPVSEKKAWYEFWKKSEKNADSKEEKLDASIDKGQEEVELLEQQRSFTEKDYLDSAVKSDKTSAKSDYAQGLQLEGLGDYEGAVRCYNDFIKANKKQTSNGTLAAPYHRLALLAWKQKESDKADVYFRYGQRYAQGGNIAIISGDYSLFLMEQGKPEQAEVILRNTLLHFPKDQRLLICLGRCCARQDKPVEGLRYLHLVMSEEQAYHELAGLYHQIGDYKSAVVMNEKRDELLAQRNTASNYGSFYNSQQVPNNQNTPLPTNRPPVMNSAANSAVNSAVNPTANSIANSTSAIPYPVINPVLPAGSPAGSSWTDSRPAPTPYNVPPETNSEPALQNVPFTSTGQPVESTAQEKQTVTKVYHYPANSPLPVYHQYAGNSYPQMVPVRVQPASNPQDVKNYWASTVPDTSNSSVKTSSSTIPADPFAMQPQQPMPIVAEQRGGYPPVPSSPAKY